jgi:hypothetical protein
MYNRTTRNIRIHAAAPRGHWPKRRIYLAIPSPLKSAEIATLCAWKITDAWPIQAAWRVGEQPTLKPGENFHYTGCQLSTPMASCWEATI